MTKAPTFGVCPACETDVLVLVSGSARKHKDPDARPCTGSGRTVATVLPLTFRRWLSTQTSRRVRDGQGHWLDLQIGRLARHAARYTDNWSSSAELLERMVAFGVRDDALLMSIPDIAITFEHLDPAHRA